jgi:AraC-like DNA-binding protein
MKADHPLRVYINHLRNSLVKIGRPPPELEKIKAILEEAGFEDVQTFTAKEPFGPWPKEPRLKKIGAMVLLHSEEAFESYGMAAFSRILGMDEEKAREICSATLGATRNKNVHMSRTQ